MENCSEKEIFYTCWVSSIKRVDVEKKIWLSYVTRIDKPVFSCFLESEKKNTTRGNIFRVQTRRVSQTIVFRCREVRGILCMKHRKNSVVPTYRILWQEQNFFFNFTQSTPRFLCSGALWSANHRVFVL
jgi:hypothetical protein